MASRSWSPDVVQRQHGAPAGIVARLLASFGLTVVDVGAEDAEIAADLWRQSAAGHGASRKGARQSGASKSGAK